MSKTYTTKEEVKDALIYLRKVIKPGATVYTILNHVSTSGMQRGISLCIIGNHAAYNEKTKKYVKRPAIINIDWYCERALGYSRHKKGGLKVGGCGMDMGFHLVYGLGEALWPKGTKKPHGTRNGEPDTTGGYALNHRWL